MLPEELQRIFSLRFEHSDDSDPMSDKVLICAETGGKHTHCLPIAFTVHGGRLPIPLCYFLSKIKCFEDPMFVQYFRLLEMSVAPKTGFNILS